MSVEEGAALGVSASASASFSRSEATGAVVGDVVSEGTGSGSRGGDSVVLSLDDVVSVVSGWDETGSSCGAGGLGCARCHAGIEGLFLSDMLKISTQFSSNHSQSRWIVRTEVKLQSRM